jgi:iron complex outermembrane receptor protein
MLRSGWRTVGTLLVALLGTWPVWAQTEGTSTIAFDISGGTLLDVIKQFSEQTGIQVTADFGLPETQEYPVAALNESLSVEAALDRILEGSGLVAKWHTPRTVRIYPKVAPRAFDGVNEVVVTGSRLRGWQDGPAPVRVYTRDDIDRLGVSSLSDLAGYFTQQPFSFGEWAQVSGAQHLQMRGLGVDTTLVLINGRRAPPSATSATLNAFDLNTIPLTAVERIEVLSDSASAIYGADAIGGVVNIILRKNIESPEIRLHYGGAAGGGEERRVSGSLGKAGERAKGSLTFDYFERGILVGAERDLWRNQDYTRFGGADYRVSAANPGNVYSLTDRPLPGLPTWQASVPAGSTGVGLTPDDFLDTAGVVSRESPSAAWSILPEFKRQSVFGAGEFSLSPSLSLFGEVLWGRGEIFAQSNRPSLLGQVVPEDNPFNPFDEAVAVDYSFAGMKPSAALTNAELTRLLLGAEGVYAHWDWELVLTNSIEDAETLRVNELDLSRVQAALSSTDPGQALNLFADGPAGDPALLASLIRDPQEFNYFLGSLQLSGFLRGRLFRLPGGVSEFVLGGEWRKEKVRFQDAWALDRARNITSWFTELRLPVIDGLSAKLALRADAYDDGKDSVNPQYGVVWQPTEGLLVRAAYGRSFRPPSLIELSTLRSEHVLAVADSRRNGLVSPVTFIAGGNPDLDNISGHSLTAGFVYGPNAWPGWKLGVHYWRVRMNNRIAIPPIADLEAIEVMFPDRVTRARPTEEDILVGRPGQLLSVDTSLLNYGSLQTSGFDIDLSYEMNGGLGKLQTALSATWVDTYAVKEISSILPANRVGIANIQGTIPRWRLVGSLTWEGNGWGAASRARFTPRYRDADLTGVMDRHLRSRATVDFQAWVELDKLFAPGLFEDMKASAGVLNVFNRKADFANVGQFLGYDASLASLEYRQAYLRITKGF